MQIKSLKAPRRCGNKWVSGPHRLERSGLEAATRDPGSTASAATWRAVDTGDRDRYTAGALERYAEYSKFMRAEAKAQRKRFTQESIIAWTVIGALILASIGIAALTGG